MNTKKISRLRKNKICKLVSSYLSLKTIEYKRINKIIFFQDEEELKKYRGKVIPLIKHNKLYFDILLDDDIGEKIIENKKLNATEKSILLHEFFHCQEMMITTNYINVDLYFKQIDSTRAFLTYVAIQQWSEYYAYYYTAKISERNMTIIKSIIEINRGLKVIEEKIQKVNSIQLSDYYLDLLWNFVRAYIMLAAHYNATKNERYLEVIKIFKNEYRFRLLYDFIINITKYLDTLFRTYPKWCSESSYEKMGNELTSFIRIYNMKFSDTNDFSVELVEDIYKIDYHN